MNKIIKIILGFFLILISFIIILSIIGFIGIKTGNVSLPSSQNKILPPLPQNETESQNLIIFAQSAIAESDKLILQINKNDLSEYNFLDLIFIKSMIWRMKREINNAKKNLDNAKQAHSEHDYYMVNVLTDSIIRKTSYANINLIKVLLGKKRKEWTKIDSIINGSEENIKK